MCVCRGGGSEIFFVKESQSVRKLGREEGVLGEGDFIFDKASKSEKLEWLSTDNFSSPLFA